MSFMIDSLYIIQYLCGKYIYTERRLPKSNFWLDSSLLILVVPVLVLCVTLLRFIRS